MTKTVYVHQMHMERKVPDDRCSRILEEFKKSGGTARWTDLKAVLVGPSQMSPHTLKRHLDHLVQYDFVRKGPPYALVPEEEWRGWQIMEWVRQGKIDAKSIRLPDTDEPIEIVGVNDEGEDRNEQASEPDTRSELERKMEDKRVREKNMEDKRIIAWFLGMSVDEWEESIRSMRPRTRSAPRNRRLPQKSTCTRRRKSGGR
jgi:hypothetical protein